MDMDLYRMTYKLEKDQTYLRILGKEFVENNGKKGSLIINNRKIYLKEIAEIKNGKIYMMLNRNIYNKNCMFKNCRLLESFSKITPDNNIKKINDMENNTNYELFSQTKIKINKIKDDDLFDYWVADSEEQNNSTISEISLKNGESLDNSLELYILYMNYKL